MPSLQTDVPTSAAPVPAARSIQSRDTILRRLVFFAVVLVLPFLVLIGIGFRNKFESDRTHAMSLLQARRSTYATEFSPAYPTTADEVARLVSIGSFLEVPCP